MENKQPNWPDDLFRDNLNGYEAPFEEGDWTNMLGLLEEDTAVPVLPPSETNTSSEKNIIKQLKNITIMTTLSIISILLMYTPTGVRESVQPIPAAHIAVSEIAKNSSAVSDKLPAQMLTPANANEKSVSNVPNNAKSSKSVSVDYTAYADKNLPKVATKDDDHEKHILPEKSVNPAEKEIKSEIADAASVIPAPVIKDGKDSLLPNKVLKQVTRKYWVEDRYEYRSKTPSGDIEDFWMGIHYTQQRPFDIDLMDSMGMRTLNHGFNWQFMSGNILKGENLAIYGGLDWGMQFYGRSKESEVTLNSVNQDKGLTRLNSSSMDILGRVHVEYAQFPVVPYFNLSAGPRIFMTGQHVSALVASKDYESTNQHNVAADASLIAGWGAGMRFKISPRVSFDARYEQYYGGKMEVVDLKHSQFNGADYTLSKNKINTAGSQFKLGLIFDLSSEDEEKILVEPGHYEEKEETLFVDPQDSNRVFVPCPCIPCEKKENVDWLKDNQGGQEGNGTIYKSTYPRGWQGGSSGGSGKKSSFPGIKTPPPIKY